ncbi:hypothetical protein [Bdellovibrio svalbardensis]|uniref:Lipoprotein n=1 Tax=Bdellovibrio svalbardensis TaxID=2972972 RepID=A0ABT6DFF4_9BACT|nr:hypothetical protein [Bdellovibrio svalbardensis]MDG0815576.1 hypothetical protein [Bdellovibrio svalbardensis]
MKRLVFIIFALFVAACADKGGGGGSNTIAVTPTDMGCINGSTVCNTGAYANYNGWTTYSLPYGSTQYNYSNYFNQYGFCGCPQGYSPAYNGSMGLGCISNQYLQPVYNYTVFMIFGSSFTGWGGGGSVNNQPQVSNIPGSPNQGTCNRNLTQSCLLDQANSCSTGATCRQVISGSNLGVCVNPNQIPSYPSYGYGGGYGYYY